MGIASKGASAAAPQAVELFQTTGLQSHRLEDQSCSAGSLHVLDDRVVASEVLRRLVKVAGIELAHGQNGLFTFRFGVLSVAGLGDGFDGEI